MLDWHIFEAINNLSAGQLAWNIILGVVFLSLGYALAYRGTLGKWIMYALYMIASLALGIAGGWLVANGETSRSVSYTVISVAVIVLIIGFAFRDFRPKKLP